MPLNTLLLGPRLIKSDRIIRRSKLVLRKIHRLWHQLTDLILAYSNEKVFDEGTDLIDLYNSLVKDVVTRVNPLKYSLITVNASRQFTDLEEAIRFLETAKGRLAGKQDATFICQIAQAEKKL